MTKVLVVDDHEIMRRGLRLAVAEALPETEFREAADAPAALAALEAELPELVLLDVNLPGRSGLDLLDEVRRRWRSLRVLVVSAYPEEDFAVRAIQLGAAGYVTKASASNELVTAVRRVVDGGRYVTAALAERLAASIGGVEREAPLSERELQVVRLVATGRTQREIAGELGLSEKTIATYRARIAGKLGVSTNVELTRWALQRGVVA